jgi:transcriptional regulator with XRE-family HTH domain
MQAEGARVGPAGLVLAANIRRVREAQRLTYVELSKRLAEVGLHIPVLALQRIETGMRRVDFDDLLGLCCALQISPVDLIVDKDAGHESYPVTPKTSAASSNVAAWIAGEDLLFLARNRDPDAQHLFASPAVPLWDSVRWMPRDRAARLTRKWLEQAERDRLNEEEHYRQLEEETDQ